MLSRNGDADVEIPEGTLIGEPSEKVSRVNSGKETVLTPTDKKQQRMNVFHYQPKIRDSHDHQK
jgi:hypothetical protein